MLIYQKLPPVPKGKFPVCYMTCVLCSVVEGEGVVWVAPSSWVSLAVITSQVPTSTHLITHPLSIIYIDLDNA